MKIVYDVSRNNNTQLPTHVKGIFKTYNYLKYMILHIDMA